MVGWLIAAAGAFYLLFRSTAPKASEVFKRGGAVEGEVEVPVQQRRRTPPPGTKPEAVADFAGANVAKVVYDPAKNPFRQAPAHAPALPDIAKPDGFNGSLDDIIPDEPLDGAVDEVPAEDAVPDDFDDTGADGNGTLG